MKREIFPLLCHEKLENLKRWSSELVIEQKAIWPERCLQMVLFQRHNVNAYQYSCAEENSTALTS